jgi:6-phosphofructokinase 1
MVALGGQPSGFDIGTVPLAEVAGRTKRVPLDGDTVRTARELGICLGERTEVGDV